MFSGGFPVFKAILWGGQINSKIKGVASSFPSTCMPAACQSKGLSVVLGQPV